MSATDPESHEGHDDVTVVVAAPNPGGNTAPVAEAGDDLTVIQGNGGSIGIMGDASGDLDGDVLTGIWECISAPACYEGDLTPINDLIQVISPLDILLPTNIATGQYAFRLTVDDGQGYGADGDGGDNQASIALDTMTLTVRNASPWPVIYSVSPAEVDITVTGVDAQLVNVDVYLLDSDISFSDGSAVVFGLQGPSGSASVLSATVFHPFSDPGGGFPPYLIPAISRFTTSFVVDLPGAYIVTLIATDGGGALVQQLRVNAYDPTTQGGVNVTIN